ncbi:Uncharacterised protein [Vibrio cholerae]|nr:Uncharacterised protein [Vibrio cholerae]CSI58994.1 Uncharacterised protein [Vibrio cholerae]CSI63381.1 Uncharacterised protein [Vibrio cholerae]
MEERWNEQGRVKHRQRLELLLRFVACAISHNRSVNNGNPLHRFA